MSVAIGLAIVTGGVVLRAFRLSGDAIANSGPTTEPSADSTPSAASRFSLDANDDLNFTIKFRGEPILHMIRGYEVRFRCNPGNDHWVGTKRHPVHLAWSPWDAPAVADVKLDRRFDDASFTLTVRGRKPEIDNCQFTTTLVGRYRLMPGHGPHESIEYHLSSTLHAKPAAVRRSLKENRIEYLDPWIEGIFWPKRDGHDRELYDYFVFGDRGGMRHTPKLHVFPSIRDATYETLVTDLDAGFLACVDLIEPDLYFRLVNLSDRGSVGICWWTWDPHFYLALDESNDAFPSFEMVIDELPAMVTPGVMAETTNLRIPFERDPDYQLPAFERDGVNRFDDMLDESDEWGWEMHSRACALDDRIGFDDKRSVTIRGEEETKTAWYTRTLGYDYFDHKPFVGGHKITAKIRTRNVSKGARIGILRYNGPETRLYDEPSPIAVWSEPIEGDSDWQTVSVKFDATGYKRFKIVLEHNGPGQSWFDNVELTEDSTADGGGWFDGVVDWRGQDWSRPQRVPWQALRCEPRKMLNEPNRLVMAWQDSKAQGPELQLPAGTYRLVVTAEGEGCSDDPPVLALKAGGVEKIGVVAVGRREDYIVEFTSDGDASSTLSLHFTNDGPCRNGSKDLDKNIFVYEIRIERTNG